MDIDKIKENLEKVNVSKIESKFTVYIVGPNNELYNITNIGNNGKVYFENALNPEDTFNAINGKSLNVEDLKKGLFKDDEIGFYNSELGLLKPTEVNLEVLQHHFNYLAKDLDKLNLTRRDYDNLIEDRYALFEYDNIEYTLKLDITRPGVIAIEEILNPFISPYTPAQTEYINFYDEWLKEKSKNQNFLSKVKDNFFKEGKNNIKSIDELKELAEMAFSKGFIIEYNSDLEIEVIKKPLEFKNYPEIFQKEIYTKSINNQNSNIMAKEEKNANEIDVKGAKTANDKPVIVYEVGDPVLAREGDNTYIGYVEKNEKGNVTIDVKNSSEVDKLTKKDTELEPLFYTNKEDKKVWLKFSYDEVSRAIKNTEGIAPKLEANQLMGLMNGERTKVMSYDKKIDNNMVTVEGRLELRRDKNGNPYVNDEVKHKELNLDLPIYGMVLTPEQKEQINKTGELGLVPGFKANDKDFSLWIGLDKDLNKVVTRREKDIYIDKIYGAELKEDQKNLLKKGEGVLITTKNQKELYVKIAAGGTSNDGLGVYRKEKAIELGLLKESKKESQEKKTSQSRGQKM